MGLRYIEDEHTAKDTIFFIDTEASKVRSFRLGVWEKARKILGRFRY